MKEPQLRTFLTLYSTIPTRDLAKCARDDRLLLEQVDGKKGTVCIGGKEYPMLDMKFPTIDWEDPLKLSEDEVELLHTLSLSFRHSDLLHKHVKFLYSHGALYKSYNKNLLYHGCIPMKLSLIHI